ncbi:hypothetical protein LC087_18640 [Bacillus carboniphilus]|uniref:Uncharacterized protein n=1 Tax=Bacillus carboniphilus TaxID=86663 RepID=A0ABY9JTF8_9BACI|nr:hypothetical protein [Bacillus carboniphilus]WLR42669.1 hypothetical protein LC087_18640 [Bacillus carboniphilus]
MFITRITTQKNNRNRYNVYIEEKGREKYAFSVDEHTLVNFQLQKGERFNGS